MQTGGAVYNTPIEDLLLEDILRLAWESKRSPTSYAGTLEAIDAAASESRSRGPNPEKWISKTSLIFRGAGDKRGITSDGASIFGDYKSGLLTDIIVIVNNVRSEKAADLMDRNTEVIQITRSDSGQWVGERVPKALLGLIIDRVTETVKTRLEKEAAMTKLAEPSEDPDAVEE